MERLGKQQSVKFIRGKGGEGNKLIRRLHQKADRLGYQDV